ncbi:MAG: 4-phosphoerythronate dehydrogenase [Ignavibacteria bacterium]|nr:4-phosphoerythronate dehydrogenase [Ignavibacteria bacterium]
MRYCFLIDNNIPGLPEILERIGEVHKFEGRHLTNEIIKQCKATILLVRSTTKVNEELLNGTEIKIVGTATSGSEHLDKKYLDTQGILYFDAIGSNALSVAEYCMFCILNYAEEYNIDLKSKVLGIIGYGNVGKRLATIAKHIGITVVINDPPLLESNSEALINEIHLEINEIVEVADVLTNHVPLSMIGKYKTHNLIDNSLLEKTKNGALLLHTSRGGVVCEESWVRMANSGRIVVDADVWVNEPNVRSKSVSAAKIATPHIAGHSYDAKLRGSLMLAKILERMLQVKLDTTQLEIECNSNKKDVSKLNKEEIYFLLKNKRIYETSSEFKKFTSDEEILKNFERMRKEYPKIRECFYDFAFNL